MSQAKSGRSGSQDEPETEAGPGETGTPGSGQGHGHECLEWCPVCRSAELLKGVTSPEMRQQLQAIQNEAMQVFKAFASAYTERAGGATEDPFSRDRNGTGSSAAGPDKPTEADEPVVTDISIE